MKRILLTAAAFGLAMPILWGIASFILFNVPEGPAADLYWRLNHFFCPFSNLPTIIELPVTAGLYALIAYLTAIAVRSLRQRKAV